MAVVITFPDEIVELFAEAFNHWRLTHPTDETMPLEEWVIRRISDQCMPLLQEYQLARVAAVLDSLYG